MPAAAAIALLMCSQALANALVDGSYDDGKTKAVRCFACHGPDGNSVNPQWPSIAGQHAPYIVRQLEAFRNGERTNILMTSQAMTLTDQDMKDVAVFFAAQTAAAKSVADPRERWCSRGEDARRATVRPDEVIRLRDTHCCAASTRPILLRLFVHMRRILANPMVQPR